LPASGDEKVQTYLIAMGLIMALLLGWVVVQHAARGFARRYPQFGPAREEGGGCLGCACKDKVCTRERRRRGAGW
jgi:LPXTG-motif cell wall-anchored protein